MAPRKKKRGIAAHKNKAAAPPQKHLPPPLGGTPASPPAPLLQPSTRRTSQRLSSLSLAAAAATVTAAPTTKQGSHPGQLLTVSSTSEKPQGSRTRSKERPPVSKRRTRSAGKSIESLVKAKAEALQQKDTDKWTEEELIQGIADFYKDTEPAVETQVEIQDAEAEAQAGQLAAPAHPESLAWTPKMTTRNKPRQGYAAKEDQGDSQEEQALWNQIQADLRKCAAIQQKQIAHTERIRELHDIINKNANASSKLYEEMDTLTREVLKLTQEEQKLLNEEPTDIIRNIGILSALRDASRNDSGRAASPAARSAKDKQRKHKGSGSGGASGGRLDGAEGVDSPGPSPIAGGRLKNSVRSSSVALGRESRDVKMEDGDAGGRSAIASEGSKGPSAEKAGKFFVGAEVAYKQAKPKEDGSQWIQCTILSITERNGKKRYEVQDPEPDETGAPGDIYTASASALIAIPPQEAELGELPVGKPVLARYPETTTFYRAEVTGFVASRSVCRLKFEDDQNQEMEVDRRFVLSLDK